MTKPTEHAVYLLYKLAESHIMPATNRLAENETSRKHTQIKIFKIPKAKFGIPEHKTGRKNIWTYTFFTFMRLCSK